MNCRSFLLLVCLFLLSTTSRAQAQTVARLLEVRGQVDIQGRSARPASVHDSLAAGERLRLSDGSSLVVAWPATGDIQLVTGPGQVTVQMNSFEGDARIAKPQLPAAQRAMVAREVKELQSLQHDDQPPRRSPKGRSMSPNIQPIHGSTVLSVEPEFTWPPEKGAAEYRLQLSTDNAPLWESKAKENRLPYRSPKPLERGLEYEWVVTASVPRQEAKKVAEGRFVVADADEVRQASQLESLAANQDEFMLSLVALRLEQQDLIAEAIKKYEALVRLSANTAAYHAALAELYERAGRTEEAQKSHQKAVQLGFQFK